MKSWNLHYSIVIFLRLFAISSINQRSSISTSQKSRNNFELSLEQILYSWLKLGWQSMITRTEYLSVTRWSLTGSRIGPLVRIFLKSDLHWSEHKLSKSNLST